MNHHYESRDDLLTLKSQIFEYLSHFHFNNEDEGFNNKKTRKTLLRLKRQKLDLIGNQIQLLNKKRKHSIYRKLSEYFEYFLQKLAESEQIQTLIASLNHHGQKLLDRNVITSANDDIYDSY